MTHLRISILALLILACSLASAQATEKVLYSFGTNPNDGAYPYGYVIFDAAGNMYGTTSEGGANGCLGCGTVFELSPSQNGTWQETTLYSFCPDGGQCPNGYGPRSGLVMDTKENLYGTTYYGGSFGYGVVFELSPPSIPGASWTEAALWSFNTDNGNAGLEARLALDAAGNLYGTTLVSSQGYGGTVFELSPGTGGWTQKTLYSFCSHYPDCPDGDAPFGGVIFDKAGNLYGTTSAGGVGGNGGWGVVYELSPGVGGVWTETVLHDFSSAGEGHPESEVSFDSAGNLYGTVAGEGIGKGCGGVFRLSPTEKGWKASTFPLNDSGVNGCNSQGEVLVENQNATLYATAANGGSSNAGVVFSLSGKGEKVLHGFCQQSGCTDGETPFFSSVTSRSGKLYGMTIYGGTGSCSGGCGVVYEIEP